MNKIYAGPATWCGEGDGWAPKEREKKRNAKRREQERE
jgi:hypothetical protein